MQTCTSTCAQGVVLLCATGTNDLNARIFPTYVNALKVTEGNFMTVCSFSYLTIVKHCLKLVASIVGIPRICEEKVTKQHHVNTLSECHT